MNNFHIYSVPRSGHHAITYWIASQKVPEPEYLGGPKTRLLNRNNYSISVNKDSLVFSSFKKNLIFKNSDLDLIKEYYNDNTKRFFILDNSAIIDNESRWSSLPKELNDLELRKIFIIRDCYNMAASLIRIVKDRAYNWPQIGTNLTTWKSHVKEVLGITNFVSDKTVILYNRWFIDEGYRRQICRSLGIEFTDINFRTVPNKAGGSSFDGLKYNENAHKMETLVRYKDYLENGLFINYLNEAELVTLNRKLFGIYGEGFLSIHNPWWVKLGLKLGLIKV